MFEQVTSGTLSIYVIFIPSSRVTNSADVMSCVNFLPRVLFSTGYTRCDTSPVRITDTDILGEDLIQLLY